jgi:hypothetical protein
MQATRTEQNPNGLATYGTPDYRTYAPVDCKDRHGKIVRMMLCEEYLEGRWEAFYTLVGR